jgi:hypothetical protein
MFSKSPTLVLGPKQAPVQWTPEALTLEVKRSVYSSRFYIVRVIKSRRMRWAGHVARMGRQACIGFWWVNLRERDHCGDPGVDGRILLEWIFGKWDVWVWTGLGWFRIETGSGQL